MLVSKRFREDYAGEFVVLKSMRSGGRNIQERVWIENTIQNHHRSNRAACISGPVDRDQFDYALLARHRGGLLESKKLQTYGTGAIYKDMRLDFLVDNDPKLILELKESQYHRETVVFTSPRQCIEHSGCFYPVPYGPALLPEAAAIYLAAFDGHEEIFLLGYHRDTPARNKSLPAHVEAVMAVYDTTEFVVVAKEHQIPEQWLGLSNVRHMNYREFISYCDV